MVDQCPLEQPASLSNGHHPQMHKYTTTSVPTKKIASYCMSTDRQTYPYLKIDRTLRHHFLMVFSGRYDTVCELRSVHDARIDF